MKKALDLRTKRLKLVNIKSLDEDQIKTIAKLSVEYIDNEILNNTTIIQRLSEANLDKINFKFVHDFYTSQGDRKDKELYLIHHNNNFIGVINLHNIDNFNNTGMGGYWMKKEERGKGYITEAMKEIIRHAFEDLKINKLFISHFDFNKGSQKVILKCGFKKIGNGRQNIFRKGKYHDEIYYDLLRSEWEESNNK